MNPFALLCGCAPGAEIPDISQVTAIQRIGQIQKLGIQRTKTGTTLNEITIATTNPNALATWTGLKGASDDTKVQFTPTINNPEGEPGEALKFGGGNATAGGVEKVVGRDKSDFTAEFHDLEAKIVEELKKYECEVDLSIFLISECGDIWGLIDSHASATKFRGIPVQRQSFFVSDTKPGGKEAVDMNFVSWSFPANWSNKLYKVTPVDFDALIQL